MSDEPRVQPESRAEWRAWLQDNHDRATGVWLVYGKKTAGRLPAVSYEEAVEEALCFGWIDSIARRLDDERMMLRFSRRKPGSGWAGSNKERIARLEAAGLMAEAGIRAVEAARADGSWTALDDIEALVVPDDLAAALAAAPGAREAFDGATSSVRKMILAWIAQARRPVTRASRIADVVSRSAAGQPAAVLGPRRD
jgi:uncharacterized protein YdeI (YjbR/CyaY-like superfamily)